MKSATSHSLFLLSLVLLCLVALYGPQTQAEAAVLPSFGHRTSSEKLQRREQSILAVKKSCKAVTSSAAPTSAKASSTSSTVVTKTMTTSATSTPTTTPVTLVLTSNNEAYGETELTSDLNRILKWAGDESNLTAAQKKEVVAAILSASARYFPEMPTKAICRIMLADIRAESDFDPTNISGARLDSGSSWGLLQVSPNGASQELSLFQLHNNVYTHNFTYGMPADTRQGIRGALLDYKTGKTIDLASLTKDDLFRPWINIHLAMWVQSNLARSSSQDPYSWAAINDYSWSLKVQARDATNSRVAATYQTMLTGAKLATTIRTGLGSWVAGPSVNGDGSYLQSGDDISNQYLNAITTSVRFLYGVTDKTKMTKAWLDTYPLNAGLVDYNTF